MASSRPTSRGSALWAGIDPVIGPGVPITVGGPIAGTAVEELINELRNAGAEALAIDDVRLVDGTVVAGEPGGSPSRGGSPTPSRSVAIGDAETLTGSLTRAGGVIAQIAATDPACP